MEIEFHNREKELKEIQNILSTRPDLITFIYGPINSGKSTLMDEAIKRLSGGYTVFHIDLRERFVSGYDDFLKVLFEVHKSRASYKQFLAKAIESLPSSVKGIPIPKNLLVELLRENDVEDVFSYIIEVFEMLKEKGKTPVMVLDELQVIGDLKIDGLLVYRLFNFFVSLTKRRHLCHVFAISSDSLFIERVYSEAMLHERAEYLLVDDFNYQTTAEFLRKYGFSDDEIDLVWSYVGGKPIHLVRLIKAEDVRRKLDELLKIRAGEIRSMLKTLKELGDEVEIRGKSYQIDYLRVVETLKKFNENDILHDVEIDEITKHYLVKKNVLFVDPVKGIIKPQSRLDLLAIKDVIGGLQR
jgi:AAA+ ATPase superfamily predicted ATPase